MANGEGLRRIERLGVVLHEGVFSLARGCKQGAVASSERSFDFAPCAAKRTGEAGVFLNVVYAILVEHSFNGAAKTSALQGLGQKNLFQKNVFDLLANLAKALLAVEQGTGE